MSVFIFNHRDFKARSLEQLWAKYKHEYQNPEMITCEFKAAWTSSFGDFDRRPILQSNSRRRGSGEWLENLLMRDEEAFLEFTRRFVSL